MQPDWGYYCDAWSVDEYAVADPGDFFDLLNLGSDSSASDSASVVSATCTQGGSYDWFLRKRQEVGVDAGVSVDADASLEAEAVAEAGASAAKAAATKAHAATAKAAADAKAAAAQAEAEAAASVDAEANVDAEVS